MNWWQTLLVAVVPVLLTLVITTWAETKRRRQDAINAAEERKERERASTQARRETLDDHWRETRLAASTELVDLSTVVQILHAVQKTANSREADGHGEQLMASMTEELERDPSVDPLQLRGQVRESMSRIRLTCGQETRDRAEDLSKVLTKILRQFTASPAPTTEEVDEVSPQYWEALRAFEAAARIELGTDSA